MVFRWKLCALTSGLKHPGGGRGDSPPCGSTGYDRSECIGIKIQRDDSRNVSGANTVTRFVHGQGLEHSRHSVNT